MPRLPDPAAAVNDYARLAGGFVQKRLDEISTVRCRIRSA
jgi:hypothetical protein